MSAIVVDASLIVAILIPETASVQATGVLADCETLVAPAHVVAEVANALLVNTRKKVIGREYRDEAIRRLFEFDIGLDREAGRPSSVRRTIELADLHNLTIYDAVYLELAIRLTLPLASLDGDLRDAARREGVEVLPA